MKDDGAPIEPADEEELRSAAALARALDGGPAEADLPQAALETAALLRLSAGVAPLTDERRAEIRRELLESLPPVSRARRRRFALPRWLVLGLPLAGTAVLGVLVLARHPEPPPGVAQRSIEQSSVDHTSVEQTPVERGPVVPDSPVVPSSRHESARAATAPAAPREGEEEASIVGGRVEQAPRAEAASRKGDLVAQRSGGQQLDGSLGARSLGARGEGAAAPSRLSRSASGGATLAPSAADAPAVNLAGGTTGDARRALVQLDRDVIEKRTELLARVSDADLSGAHAELDAAKKPVELESSQRTLTHTLETLGDGLDPTDARLVRQDLYCRLAETALRLGQPRAALEWTRRGLDLDGPPTPFLAQLMALEGDAWAALGEDASAASSYMRALRVQETMLDESLDGH
jgi:predicted negative regulator of RcsB-dependent stress response